MKVLYWCATLTWVEWLVMVAVLLALILIVIMIVKAIKEQVTVERSMSAMKCPLTLKRAPKANARFKATLVNFFAKFTIESMGGVCPTWTIVIKVFAYRGDVKMWIAWNGEVQVRTSKGEREPLDRTAAEVVKKFLVKARPEVEMQSDVKSVA